MTDAPTTPHETGEDPCQNCGYNSKAPWRNGYFTGKMLTKRDFRAEQRYFLELARRHDAHLHGWGIVCGLDVRAHPICPRERVIVGPGLAIDAPGREINVPHDTEVDIPDQLVKAALEKNAAADRQGKTDPVPGGQHCPEPIRLYLCLRYQECKEEWTNAPFEECGCGPQPAQIFDGFCLELTEGKPASFTEAEVLCGGERPQDCGAFLHSPRHCHLPPCDHCIPLAVLTGWPSDGWVREWEIDGSMRVGLPSTAALAQAVRCLTRRPRTRITNFNWEHNDRIELQRFIERYVSDKCQRRGFDVDFSCPLHPGTVRDGERNPLIFQATFLFHEAGAIRPEIAPATLIRRDDTRLRLELDPTFGHKLHGCHFDVPLHLPCNFLLDQHGCPVDGNLLAHLREGKFTVPHETGDGVAGGLFESWIRVHRH